jgi:hypothetical protein
MHDPKTRQVQPQRECEKPVDDFRVQRCSLDLAQKDAVLVTVFDAQFTVTWPQKMARVDPIRVWQVPRNRVELVIAQDGQSTVCLNHVSREPIGVYLPGTSIDEVAHKDGLSGRVPVGTRMLTVAHRKQQSLQLVSLTMNVTNNVVFHRNLLVA